MTLSPARPSLGPTSPTRPTSHRAPTSTPDLDDQLETTELSEAGDTPVASGRGARRTPPKGLRRPALYLAAAAAGALMVNVLAAGAPAAGADLHSVSIAKQLGISSQSATVRPLQQLVASRSERQTELTAAARAQAAADRAEQQKRDALLASRAALARAQALAASRAKLAAARAELAAKVQARAQAAAKAARAAAAAQAAATPAPAPAPAAAPAAAAPAAGGSYQSYALSKLGGDSGQMSCLENLWGRESGWNPTAQNPSSSAYGIPQFLDSTWASTGIAKTSDGYRQIDAGLIYLDQRYGSPCGGWAHSQSTGWY